MKAAVFSHEHPIGSVELHVDESANNTLAGEMQCAPHYDQIAHILHDINSGLPRGNNMSMEELRINVRLANGCFLFPAQGFSIRELPNDGTQHAERTAELRAVGVMPHVIENFFVRRPAREWPLQHWQAPDIALKLKMEDELLYEIGQDVNEHSNGDSTPNNHPLSDWSLCAQLHFNHWKDCVFTARHRQSGREAFVLVQVPWSNRRERGSWPMFQFFNSWNSFRRRCLRYGEDIEQYLNTPAQQELYRRFHKEMAAIDAVVYSGTTCIGTARLCDYDRSMGVIGGIFFPNAAYASVQKLIWKFYEFNDSNGLKYLHAAHLNVQINNNIFLSPAGGIEICDIKELQDSPEAPEVIVAGLHWQIIENFLDRAVPLPWLKPPWRPISIEEKLDFEQKLDQLLLSMQSGGDHNQDKPLPVRNWRFDYGTLAVNSLNKKVLFDLQRSNHGQFVIVDFNNPSEAFEYFENRDELP